jgi:hypothetical protein
MAYNQLISAQLLKTVETVNNLGTKTGSFTISWADGHFQYYTTGGDSILGFSNWPTSAFYTKLRLQITTDSTIRKVTFPAAVSVGLSDIQGAVGQEVTLPANGIYLFELTTLDNGDTITIQDLLRNYDITTAGNSGAFSTVTVSSLASITSNTRSTSSATGALVVTGGVGIGGNLNVDRNLTVKGTLRSIFKTFSVKIDDDGSGTQEVFFFDNVAIRTNTGVYSNISFFPGQTYRFDLSDVSNSDGPLRFSTTSDISVPGSITDYTTGVDRSNIAAGNAGAYVDLTVRSDTPSPIFIYAEEADIALDTSNIGGQLPIPIRGTVSTVDATVITGNLTVNGGTINTTGNVLAAGGVLNALIVNGTTTRAGATVDSGYQFYQPSANVFVQANVNVSRVILAPIGTALVSFSANVTLPNTTVDGTVVSISSNSAVQFFSVMAPYPDSGRQITPQGNVALSAGAKAEYLYRSTDNTWYKVG